MIQAIDIRDQAHLSGEEVLNLNFIQNSGRYIFRKYYRFGLRSHIFEVLLKTDVVKETRGVLIDGIRVFPRAKPKKMFRILRHRFENVDSIFKEIEKYNLLIDSLGAEMIATSEEFIVDYTGTGTSQIVLCGLQEYIEGDILDPWRIFDHNYLNNIYKSNSPDRRSCLKKTDAAHKSVALFVKKIRQMIKSTGFIPDLAGIGNLVLTPEGRLKLVDINNIVKIRLDDDILIDDKGYPSCDVSIEVLSLLENRLLQKSISMNDSLYCHFLSPQRMKKVKALEKKFYGNL